MFDFTGLSDMKGWMRSQGEGAGAGVSTESPGGVVISSRVRLARNLAQYPFPGRCPADVELEYRDKIISAFRRLPNVEDFAIIYMDDLSALERRILFERNIISQGYSLEKQRAMVLERGRNRGGDHRGRGPPAPGGTALGRVPGDAPWQARGHRHGPGRDPARTPCLPNGDT